MNNSCQIWCVTVFHNVPLKYGHENGEMKKKNDHKFYKFSWGGVKEQNVLRRAYHLVLELFSCISGRGE